jgi:hypothetical protein
MPADIPSKGGVTLSPSIGATVPPVEDHRTVDGAMKALGEGAMGKFARALERSHEYARSMVAATAIVASMALEMPCPAVEPTLSAGATPIPPAPPTDGDPRDGVAPLPGVDPIVIAAHPRLLHRHREAAPAEPIGKPRLRFRHVEPAVECPPAEQGQVGAPSGQPMPSGQGVPPSPVDPSNPGATGTPGVAASPLPPASALAGLELTPDQLRASTMNRSSGGGRISEGLNRSPNLQGDGCAPAGTFSQLLVGRLCINVPGLDPTTAPYFHSNSAALLEGVSTASTQFNTAQGVAPSFTQAFNLPSQNLGSVPGTGPSDVTASGPQSGPYPPSNSSLTLVTTNDAPAAFLAAADNAFRTNPSLQTTQWPAGSTVTAYDPQHSGVIVSGTTAQAFLYYDYLLDSPLILPGYAVGFVKLTENMSPLPRDRVYMNYSYFHNANFFPTRADVNRFMPGFEKTFYDGWTSIEVRTPFAATLSNSQMYYYDSGVTGGGAGTSEYRDVQFGNMSTIFKTILLERQTWAITGGVQVMLPTASNTQVGGPTMFAGQSSDLQSVFVANESVHVMPFVGSVWAPNDRFFSQALLQIDRDVNGNPAYVNTSQTPGISGRQLDYAGRLFYPTFMYLSLGTGYWIYKDDTQNLTGFSPVFELHVNQAFNEFCPIQYGGWTLGPNVGTVSVTNALIGCNFEWGTRSTLSLGYVTPLGGGVDRFFDGELRAMYNWRFGPQNSLRRAQF